MPTPLPADKIRALKDVMSSVAMQPEERKMFHTELEEIARQVECANSALRVEQYKTMEARIDRMGTTQFGLWPVGVGAFLGLVALSNHVKTPPLAWAICFVASLLTVIGWQCSIAANRIGSYLIVFHDGCERAMTVITEPKEDLIRNISELGLWPLESLVRREVHKQIKYLTPQ